MRRRLLTAMLLTAIVAVVGFGLPLALAVQTLYRDEALLVLSQRASEAVVAVPATFAKDNDPPEFPDFGPDVHAALYGRDGRRLQGQGPDTADEPVRQALGGSGAARTDDLVVAVPVSDAERVVAAVRVSTPVGAVDARTRRTWAAMAGLAALVLAAAGLIAAVRSRSLARPLAQLCDDAAAVGAGNQLPARDDTGVPEIAAVRAALDAAAGQLSAALERERAFSADLAHQLRTPLTSLRLRLETEQLAPSNPELLVSELLGDADRLEQTVDDLLLLARDTSGPRPVHALATSVREAGQRWTPAAAAAGRELSVELEPHLPWVAVSSAALRQVLDVLLDNALRHGSGQVTLSAARVGTGAVVSVSDQGTRRLDSDGVFVRRAGAASGTGIGLALARRLAEAEDMRLVLAEPGPGPAFHLVLRSAGQQLPR
ncbi:MAG: HAMP domain-containing histidine kinase [Frankiales bacterium]|nr:MAG: HAMP domain-containing histidine kinase [Frankiales bacterium]